MKIKLGKKLLSANVKKLIEKDPSLAIDITKCIKQHARGDWGLIDQCDREMNNHAIEQPGSDQIFSTYKIREIRIRIITDKENKITTVILPEEY